MVSKSISWLRTQAVRAFDIKEPARLRHWLWRVYFRPLPGRLAALLLALYHLLVAEFGIRHPERPLAWLRCVYFRTSLAWRPDVCPRWLRACASGLGHVKRRLWACLPDIDYARVQVRSERLTERLQGPRWLRYAVFVPMAAVWLTVISAPLSFTAQLAFFMTTWLTALFMRRVPGRLAVLLLITLSLIATGRYVWWRLTQTLYIGQPVETVLGVLLLLAEVYSWIIMLLGYLQTAWPLRRPVAPLELSPGDYPAVDIYIPTYNEPLSVIRPTVHAAGGIDWPRDKLNVYILDDGRRAEFRGFAAEAGVGYITRSDNAHAKAGNINNALKQTTGEFIAIFDCDHIPTRCFLKTAMRPLLNDPNCALAQTPHHFFSPDPFERNLGTFRRVPNEGVLFHGLIQDGNDLWNASFFCGSCAVIRRGPLEEVGGIAVETVTEDAHTALRLHRLGYSSAYVNSPQAAGLATESLAGHIGQRIRWARGMVQIFRLDNPLLGKGLTLFQRLCYGNAMLYFLYGLPRIVFLTMPLAYLLFQYHVIKASPLLLAAFVVPHMFHSHLANSAIQGRHRHSFWADVYETVLAWYVTRATALALINPRHGKFNVTAKGGVIHQNYFDWAMSRPLLALLLLNLSGLAFGVVRLFWWNSAEVGTVIVNMIWAAHNLVILGAAVGVAYETRQCRLAHRVTNRLPVTLLLPDGRSVAAQTADYSTDGLGVRLPEGVALAEGDLLRVRFPDDPAGPAFPTQVVTAGAHTGLRFGPLSAEEEKRLVQCTFGRADAWTDWAAMQQPDAPVVALREMVGISRNGYLSLLRYIGLSLRPRRRVAAIATAASAALANTAGATAFAPGNMQASGPVNAPAAQRQIDNPS